MLVHASESADVPVNVRGTLDAAHDAIGAFFLLFKLLESEARVWWVFNHRAFLEALCIGNVLQEANDGPEGDAALLKDPIYARAKSDICESLPSFRILTHQDVKIWGEELTLWLLVLARMIQVLQLMSEESEVASARVEVLGEFLAL